MKLGKIDLTAAHGLLAGIAVVIAALVFLWWPGRDPWQPPQPLPPDAKAIAAVKIDLPNSETAQLRETVERPLFSETRRPPPPPPPPGKAPEPDPLEKVRIHALIGGADGKGVAILEADGKTQRVKVGSTYGPWSLKAIKGKTVVFARGNETREAHMVHLAYAAPPPPPPPEAPAKNAPQAAGAAPAGGQPGAPGAAGTPAAPTAPAATNPPTGKEPTGLLKNILDRQKRLAEKQR